MNLTQLAADGGVCDRAALNRPAFQFKDPGLSAVSEDVELDYDYMMQRALRYLMRDVLELVADVGDAPGEHHFYIEFLTSAAEVSIPDFLREDYPERMTIVLQHQFEQLTVTDTGFGVTLWFKGKEARLEIPYAAVTSFADPSVQFGLRFEPIDNREEDDADKTPPQSDGDQATAADDGDSASDEHKKDSADGADIVSLDAFRKK